jgi:hypothetical protein
MTIDDLPPLRALCPVPSARALRKQLDALGVHCTRFIALRVYRTLLPTMGQMINDPTGIDAPAETDAQMRARCAADL